MSLSGDNTSVRWRRSKRVLFSAISAFQSIHYDRRSLAVTTGLYRRTFAGFPPDNAYAALQLAGELTKAAVDLAYAFEWKTLTADWLRVDYGLTAR